MTGITDRDLYRKFLDEVGFSDDPDASAWCAAHEKSFLSLIAAAREEGFQQGRRAEWQDQWAENDLRSICDAAREEGRQEGRARCAADKERLDWLEMQCRRGDLEHSVVVLGSWWSEGDQPDGFSVNVGELTLNPEEFPSLREAIDDVMSEDQASGKAKTRP